MEPHLIKFRPKQWVEVVTVSHEMHVSMAEFVRKAVDEKLDAYCQAQPKTTNELLALPTPTKRPDTS